jgi:hypothetical protein
VASRVNIAAAFCLVAAGLFAGGGGTAVAVADPGHNDSRGGAHRSAGPRNQSEKPRSKKDRSSARPGKHGYDLDRSSGKAKHPGRGNPDGKDRGKPAEPCWLCGEVPLPVPTPSPGGGGGGLGEVIIIRPNPPEMQLPEAHELSRRGSATVTAEAPAVVPPVAPVPRAPLTVPVVRGPVVEVGGGAEPPAAPLSPGPPAAPNPLRTEPPTGREPEPAGVGGPAAAPGSFRVGYAEQLRTAEISRIVALALPGLAGLVVLTAAGGVVGYRQAKAGHVIRTSDFARYMN